MDSIAVAGLGRMGANMALRLAAKGVKPFVWNRTPAKAEALRGKGAEPAATLPELVSRMKAPRAVWMMLPAGAPTDELFLRLLPALERGDMIIDGANGHWRDAVRRAEAASARGLEFLDAGVSGGIWGLSRGYCVMAGGSEAAFSRAEPFLKHLCAEGGYLRCGGPGAGHYAKMAHNAIEYGLMAAYGEGFELMKSGPYGELDPALLAGVWSRGSVIESWLLDLLQNAFDKDPGLASASPEVADSGEGRWSVEEGIRLGVPMPVISAALWRRFESRDRNSLANRAASALRAEFGGHGAKGPDA